MLGVFLGEQSSGKTLAMTYFAYLYNKLGYNIFCNYNMKFKHQKVNMKMIKDYVLQTVQFNKSVFCLDELYLMMDTRNFGKSSNKIFSYFLLQTSKRDVHLLGTAQYFNTIEKRFRENCNFMCFCNRVIFIDGTVTDFEDSNRKLSKKENDNLYIKLNFVKKTSIDGIIPQMKTKIMYLKASPVFELYDTRELLALDV